MSSSAATLVDCTSETDGSHAREHTPTTRTFARHCRPISTRTATSVCRMRSWRALRVPLLACRIGRPCRPRLWLNVQSATACAPDGYALPQRGSNAMHLGTGRFWRACGMFLLVVVLIVALAGCTTRVRNKGPIRVPASESAAPEAEKGHQSGRLSPAGGRRGRL